MVYDMLIITCKTQNSQTSGKTDKYKEEILEFEHVPKYMKCEPADDGKIKMEPSNHVRYMDLYFARDSFMNHPLDRNYGTNLSLIFLTHGGIRENKKKIQNPRCGKRKLRKASDESKFISGPNVFTVPSMLGENVIGNADVPHTHSIKGRYSPFFYNTFNTPFSNPYTSKVNVDKKRVHKCCSHSRQTEQLKDIPGPGTNYQQKYNAHKIAKKISYSVMNKQYSI
ncbi:uncharacterized protein LOC119669069 [Teleopsis dalmanni]|uniref:uncharacterized protein LOC119669069 n=1 Tax=Teleopsis dalmanni TaxID=139649 RepID=UPI0018CD081F|nr:uncharacterized protein LOC119669069 [Teleopsis dalmanni]